MSLQPEDGQSYGYQAFAQFASGESGQAEENARKATELPNGEAFKTLLATIYYSEGKYKLVSSQLSNNSNDTFALTLLAGAALRSGDVDTFHSLNSKIADLKGAPGGWALYADGVAAEKNLDFTSALEKFRACDADDDFIDSACIIAAASTEARQGQYQAAKNDISLAVNRYPADHSALAEAIFIDLLTGDVEHATQMHSQLKALPSISQDEFSDCLYYYGINQSSLAEPYCSEATRDSPESGVAWSNAGYVAIDEGDFASAARYFTKAKDIYDSSKEKHTVTEELDLSWGIAITLYGSGDRKDAKALYRAIKKTYPEFSNLSTLKQLPLLWSERTQALIGQVIAEFR
ncbi:MAG: hypothetical protein WBW84_01100 [Acidobacteriaceae bacterium]